MLRDNPRVLCACTIGNPPFAELVALAAQHGFQGLSLWRPYLEQEQQAGTSLLRMRELLRQHGVVVDQVEAVMAWSSAEASEAEAAAECEAVIELAQALDARRILAVNMATPLPPAAMKPRFSALCRQVEAHGLGVALEFLPWSGIPDLDSALALLDGVGPAHGLMLDSWHILRSGTAPAALAALPGERIAGVQWNDPLTLPEAPASFEETLRNRALPGEGIADLAALARALSATGTAAPQAVEVMNLGGEAAAQWAPRAAAALQGLLALH